MRHQPSREVGNNTEWTSRNTYHGYAFYLDTEAQKDNFKTRRVRTRYVDFKGRIAGLNTYELKHMAGWNQYGIYDFKEKT